MTPQEIGTLSRWLDAFYEDPAEVTAAFADQDFRRCIKSHSPLDGITYDPRCSYFAVYRHPIDALFSMRVHARSIEVEFLRNRFPDDDNHAAFEMFLKDELFGGANDAFDLHSLVYHYKSFQKWAHLPNIHLLHYADLKADLAGEVRRIARILEIEERGSLVTEITEGSTFAAIKKKAAEAKSESGDFYLSERFFNSGTSNKWDGVLDKVELAAFDARMRELLPEDQAAWLLWGSKGQP